MPAVLGALTGLQELGLAGRFKLTALPAELGALRGLLQRQVKAVCTGGALAGCERSRALARAPVP